MILPQTDQRELVTPLFAGILQNPPWEQFLTRLLARTGAERASVIVRGPGGSSLDSWAQAYALRDSAPPQPDVGRGAPVSAPLRPLRVYSFTELRELEAGQAPRTHPDPLLAHGRVMRVPAGGGWDAWLMIEHREHVFAAADSVLLSSLGPHLAGALALLLEIDRQRRRAELAERALAALGVTQALLDRDLRPVVGAVPFSGARLAHAGALARGGQAVLPGATPEDPALLIRPAPPGDTLIDLPDAAVALTRTAAAAALDPTVLARLYGLSPREAELAAALCQGAELVPAGLALGLTTETTRNYSKRIYAKTGTRGQVDLVRLVLTGLAPLAPPAATLSERESRRRLAPALPA